jgi:hypothetical protein
LPHNTAAAPHTTAAAPHLVVVHAGAQGAEEVDGLAREGVHQLLHVAAGDAVVVEDAHAHADAVLAGGVPVVLLHTPVTDEGGVQGGEVVTGADDGHARDLLVLVHAWGGSRGDGGGKEGGIHRYTMRHRYGDAEEVDRLLLMLLTAADRCASKLPPSRCALVPPGTAFAHIARLWWPELRPYYQP